MKLSVYGQALPGEDRAHGGNAFYVDMIPASAQLVSLRSCLEDSDWKAISQYVIERAGRKCEICGSTQKPESHERWRFRKDTQIQDVARLLCVCKKCHLGIHYSLARGIGMREQIDAHIMGVTGWDRETLCKHVREQTKLYLDLSSSEYAVDLGLIEKIGVIPRSSIEIAGGARGQIAALAAAGR